MRKRERGKETKAIALRSARDDEQVDGTPEEEQKKEKSPKVTLPRRGNPLPGIEPEEKMPFRHHSPHPRQGWPRGLRRGHPTARRGAKKRRRDKGREGEGKKNGASPNTLVKQAIP